MIIAIIVAYDDYGLASHLQLRQKFEIENVFEVPLTTLSNNGSSSEDSATARARAAAPLAKALRRRLEMASKLIFLERRQLIDIRDLFQIHGCDPKTFATSAGRFLNDLTAAEETIGDKVALTALCHQLVRLDYWFRLIRVLN